MSNTSEARVLPVSSSVSEPPRLSSAAQAEMAEILAAGEPEELEAELLLRIIVRLEEIQLLDGKGAAVRVACGQGPLAARRSGASTHGAKPGATKPPSSAIDTVDVPDDGDGRGLALTAAEANQDAILEDDRRAPPPPRLRGGPRGASVTLRPGEISLHRATFLDLAKMWGDGAPSVLDADERARMAAFRTADLQRRYALGRAATKSLLASAAACDVRVVTIATEAEGRPFLRHLERLRLSVAHTRTALMVGLRWDADLGVDIEDDASGIDIEDLARRYFHPQEVAELESLPENHRPARFLRLWTLKEASLKCCGVGLSGGLSTFAFQWRAGELRLIDGADDLRHLTFRAGNGWGALAYRGTVCQITTWPPAALGPLR